MPTTTDLSQIIRDCGPSQLLGNDAATVLFPAAVQTKAELLLGHQIMGEPRKHDSVHIRFSSTSPTSGIAQGVDLNASAHEVDQPILKTDVFGAISTKETISFDHETLTAIHSATAGCASDAQTDLIARSLMRAYDTLADRLTQFIEKTFWDGAQGQMSIDIAGSSIPVVTPTGTTVMPSLTGTDIWTDSVNSSPLSDIEDLKRQLRGTGYTPGCMVMNQITYDAFVNADSVKTALGDCLCQVNVLGESLPRVRGIAVKVYDHGYIDDAGTFIPYIPDGKVLLVGESASLNPVQRFDCVNVDDCQGVTYGSFVEVLKDKNPMQRAVYHSYIGAPVFAGPAAFVSQQVF